MRFAKNMKNISIAVGATSILSSTLVCAGETEKQTRPNILFMMSDDHTSEALSVYKSWLKDYVDTPNIQRLSDEGIHFANVCCNNSICSPSRASVLTGQYSHKNGVKGLHGEIYDESPRFIEELSKSGYQTSIIGKWHLNSTPKGFDSFQIMKNQGDYFNPTLYTDAYSKNIKKKHEGYSAEIFSDLAIDYMDKRDKSKPFALMVQYKATHASWKYPKKYEDMLKGVTIPEHDSFFEDVKKTSPFLKAKYVSFFRNFMSNADLKGEDDKKEKSERYQKLIKDFLRTGKALDDNIGRILDYLDENDLRENTIVVYTADQGYWLGQHGFWDKRLILETSLKMPFIVRYPSKIKAKSFNNDLCSNVDFSATFLDYANVAIPEAMQGKSMKPLLQGEDTPKDWRKAIYYSYFGVPAHYGIRTKEYKLIHILRPNGEKDEIELYDLKNDPNEMKNVANNPQYIKALAECEAELATLKTELDIKENDLPKYKKPAKIKGK